MSFSRKNWSALSSLARQRTLEDEEEQARERRQRERRLSSAVNAEDEAPPPTPNASEPALQRLHSLEKVEPPAASPAEEEMPKQKLTAELRPQAIRRQRWQVESLENLTRENKRLENCREPETGASGPEAALPHGSAQAGSALLGEECQGVAKEPTGPTAEQCPKIAPKQHPGAAQNEKDLKVDEPPPKQEVSGSQPHGPAQGQKDHSYLEVKILSRAGSHVQQKPGSPVTPSSVQQAQESAGSLSTQDKPRCTSVASPTQVLYSSSFKRISPRTVSFRVISRKDQEENAFIRSASMRVPASCTRIEEKLEQYTSAVQRSEVKLPMSVPRSFVPSSQGVASKRSIFEANAPGKADAAPLRKENLRLPGVVSSRINLWISRTQEPSKDGRMKDAGKRDRVAEQPDDSSSDTRL
ncbi:ladinin-1 [Carettochelys insculpta]|uniref:ladinin-1 n=1 Tax=Carettochelys insculpta TaxID=44489 RepID=UPI003EBB62F7